jgi:hypothetical protein
VITRCPRARLRTNLLLSADEEEKDMHSITPEAVTAEIAYRMERARTATIAEQARRPRRPSWLRRLWSPDRNAPARRMTPALP